MFFNKFSNLHNEQGTTKSQQYNIIFSEEKKQHMLAYYLKGPC